MLPALQARKLNQECTAGNLSAQLLYDLNGRIHGTAGSQKIIHDQHPLSFFDAVPVNVQLIASVFQIIGYAYSFSWQLSRLAYRYKSDSQLIGDRTAEDKAAIPDRQ